MTLSTTPLHDVSLTTLATALRQRQISATETAQYFLARARSHAELGAYVALNEAATLAQAAAADARLAAGTLGRLPARHKAHDILAG